MLDPATDIMDQFFNLEINIKHQFLDPETDKKHQFLGPKTDVMGEGNFLKKSGNHKHFIYD